MVELNCRSVTKAAKCKGLYKAEKSAVQTAKVAPEKKACPNVHQYIHLIVDVAVITDVVVSEAVTYICCMQLRKRKRK